MVKAEDTGFQSRSMASDVVLGLFDGIDNALWSYGFATILFAGSLSVFLPTGLTLILVGWALFGVYVAVTSKARVHLVNIDEQAVVILGSAGLLMAGMMGDDIASPRGLATFLALLSLSSVAVAASYVLVGRFRLVRLLELLPYPVICGFMAGVGWLLLEAAVFVSTGHVIGPDLLDYLGETPHVMKLAIVVVCGIGVTLWVSRINRVWALPVASAVLFVGFYTIVFWRGLDSPSLIADGWLFDIPDLESGALSQVAQLSFSDVDLSILAMMWPQVLTIAFLGLLSVSMSLTAMSAGGRNDIETADELRRQGRGNVLCALVGSPPGQTDIASSLLYQELGVSSRWMGVVSSLVCLVIAVFGTAIIALMPKVVVAATIFMFAFLMLYEWMYRNVRGFQPVDMVIVVAILAVVIFFSFMLGVLTGVLLTLMLFVMRYSMISAIQGRYSLRDYRSSVERTSAANDVLDQHGSGVLIYTLRGFLFFGTANAVLDRIKRDLGKIRSEHDAVLLDFKRVTGIDISALNTFALAKSYCEYLDVKLMYSGVRPDVEERILAVDAVSSRSGRKMLFPELDFALEHLEEQVLDRHFRRSGQLTVREQLAQILPEEAKIDLLVDSLKRVTCKAGQHLFLQGDGDSGFYLLESGHMSAFIDAPGGQSRRVKKFGPGSLIGELSSYTPQQRRTATVTADEDSVLYHMSSYNLHYLEGANPQLAAAIHELIARTLGSRMNYMNRRLLLELE